MAPFMLFRTNESSDSCLKAYSRATRWIFFHYSGIGLFLPLVGFGVRILFTIYWAIRKPLRTIQSAPENWLRQSFCTDVYHPPEIVPMETIWRDSGKDNGELMTWSNMLWAFKDKDAPFRYKLLAVLIFVIPGFLPSLIYRFAFKATSILYAPFVWVVHSSFQKSLPLKLRLERITKGELEKTRRAVSWFILTMVLLKLGLMFGWIDVSVATQKIPSPRLLEAIVIAQGWHWWQMSLISEALITFGLFYFADAALARITEKQVWKESIIQGIVSSTSFLRSTLAVATMFYGFYSTMLNVDVLARIKGVLV